MPAQASSNGNGAGPHRVTKMTPSLDDITRAMAACIKEAADTSSVDKINFGIGKEISKAAQNRFHHK